jgi:CheY-like chemotaxis protein
MRVLLVDDEPETREAMVVLLARLGVDAAGAATTAAALALVEDVDAIVLDLYLAGESGATLAQLIRARSSRHVPIVLTTGGLYDGPADLFDAVLTKPCSADQVLAAIRGAMS